MHEPASDSADIQTSEIQTAPLGGQGASGKATLSEAAKQDAEFSTTPKKEPAAAATGKPWGGWGGWGSISTTLTGLAAATAKDLSDLSSNLQNVIVVDQAEEGASSSPAPLAANDGRDASLVGAQDLLETAEPSKQPDSSGMAPEATAEVNLTSQDILKGQSVIKYTLQSLIGHTICCANTALFRSIAA